MTTNQILRNNLAAITGNALVALAYGCEIHLAAEADGSGTCWVREPDDADLPPEIRRTIGIAGPIAKASFLHGGPEAQCAEELMAHLQSGAVELPPQAAGYTLADVEFALRVLTDNWPLLEEQVAIREHQILNGGAKPH